MNQFGFRPAAPLFQTSAFRSHRGPAIHEWDWQLTSSEHANGPAAPVADLVAEYSRKVQAQEFPAALALAEKIRDVTPDALQAHLRVATILLHSDRDTEATELLRGIVQRWPDRARAHAAFSRALLRTGDSDGAIAAAIRSVELEPDVAKHHDLLSQAYARDEQFEMALESLGRAVALEPDSAGHHAALTRLLLRLDRPAEAREAGLKTLELDPGQQQIAKLLRTIVLPGEERPMENKTSLDGADGFLFHETDAAFIQMCGPPADPHDVTALAGIITSRLEWCTARGMIYRMLVIPERHVLYDDKLPEGYAAQPKRMAARLVQAIAPAAAHALIYPFAALRAGRAQHDVCLRGDVHWSTWGAYLSYRALLASIPDLAGEIIPESALRHRTASRVGDMTMWRGLRTRETCEIFDAPKTPLREVMSTKTFTTGQVDVFATDHPSGRRLVLFRTSNSTALMPLFAHHFSRIVTVATTSVAFDLLESERPHFVFSELPERYLAIPAKADSPKGIRLPKDFESRSFLERTGCELPLP
jgi:tetratricopeptide (TPR) repeat protein